MKDKFTSYSLDGIEYEFNRAFFKDHFKSEAKRRGIGIEEFKEQLAKAVYVSASAVHSWRTENTTPGDIEKVELIAQFLGVQKEQLLIKFEKFEMEDEEMTNQNKTDVTIKESNNKKLISLDSIEKEALSRVYNSILDFVDEYYHLSSVYTSYEHGIEIDYELEEALRNNKSLQNTLLNSEAENGIERVLVAWESIVEGKRMKAQKAILSSMMDLPVIIYCFLDSIREDILDDPETNIASCIDFQNSDSGEYRKDYERAWENCHEMLTNAEWIKSYFESKFFMLRMVID